MGLAIGNALMPPLTEMLIAFNSKMPDLETKFKGWTSSIQEFGSVVADVFKDTNYWIAQLTDAVTGGGLAFAGMFDRLLGGAGNDADVEEVIERMKGRALGKLAQDSLGETLKQTKPVKIGESVNAGAVNAANPNQIVGTLKLEVTKGASELARKIQDAIYDPSGMAAQQIAIAKDQVRMLKDANTTLKKIADKPTVGAVAQ